MILDEALDLLDRCYHSPAKNVVRAEVEQLRHDIARHVQITAEQARELEELRAELAAARAALDGIPKMILSPAYYGETEWGKAILVAPSEEKK